MPKKNAIPNSKTKPAAAARFAPLFIDRKLFRPVFEIAKISNFNDSELHNYEASMKYLNDYNNTIEYAKKEGETRGVKKLFALWESGVPLAEAKRKFGLKN